MSEERCRSRHELVGETGGSGISGHSRCCCMPCAVLEAPACQHCAPAASHAAAAIHPCPPVSGEELKWRAELREREAARMAAMEAEWRKRERAREAEVAAMRREYSELETRARQASRGGAG